MMWQCNGMAAYRQTGRQADRRLQDADGDKGAVDGRHPAQKVQCLPLGILHRHKR